MTSNSTAMSTEEYQAQMALLKKGCHAYISSINPNYGYVPSLAGGIVFCVLFGACFFYHFFQSCRIRAATSILLALGALTELIGWASRTYAAECPYSYDAFLSQIVTLIIAPVFFSAALYVLLGKLIINLGRGSSMLSPRMYTIIFCTCDLISLVIQAIGGAQASLADTVAAQDQGTHIMVAGIVFQLFTMSIFGVLVADFYRRVTSRQRDFRTHVTRGMRMALAAMLVSFIMIYIRSIYRTVELAQGWKGYLITRQGYFIGLDATIMVIAVGVFIPIDPAVIFRGMGKPGYGTQTAVKQSPNTSDTENGVGMRDQYHEVK